MRVRYLETALKSLKKLDKHRQKLIISYMDNIEKIEEPRVRGKSLSANLKGFWIYRISDFRIICEIIDDELIICVIDIIIGNKCIKDGKIELSKYL